MVIDDLAFICTFNFADKYFKKTRGYAVVTRNRAEVEEVLAGFEAEWERREFTPDRLVWSQTTQGNSRRRMDELIDSAQHELHIQNPKLVDDGIVYHLLATLERGVKVHGMFGPSSLLVLGVRGRWQRLRQSRWRELMELATRPFAVGTMLASATLVAVSTNKDASSWAITLGAAALVASRRLGILPTMALAGLAGYVAEVYRLQM